MGYFHHFPFDSYTTGLLKVGENPGTILPQLPEVVAPCYRMMRARRGVARPAVLSILTLKTEYCGEKHHFSVLI
jgi:hypothetical protein